MSDLLLASREGVDGVSIPVDISISTKMDLSPFVNEPFEYGTDLDFSLDLRMFPALAYVPVRDVRRAFNLLVSSSFVVENEQLLTEFINYFELQWVGRRRNPPRVKLDWWNLYAATLEGAGRTNDHTEGWPSAFSKRINCTSPCFSNLVKHLRLEQA